MCVSTIIYLFLRNIGYLYSGAKIRSSDICKKYYQPKLFCNRRKAYFSLSNPVFMYNTSFYFRPSLRPLTLLFCLLLAFNAHSQQKDDGLRIVLIRHGEKPKDGSGLNCRGINRAKALPAVLYAKIGLPGLIYVPSVAEGDATKHSRMSQTITPFAEKYHLPMNSDYKVNNIKSIAKDVLKQKGTVLVVWEHNGLEDLAEQLGVKEKQHWDDKDFDTIWIITFSKKGKARLQVDHEGLHPSAKCS